MEGGIEVRVDGRLVENWGQRISGKRLVCVSEHRIFIFEIPIDEYQDLEEKMNRLDGKQVDMGVMPHLIVFGETRAHVTIKRNRYYDFFAISERGVEGGGRLSTGKDKPPYPLTLEEAKLLAITDVGASLEQAKGVGATIVPMTAWGTGPGRFIIVGFCLGSHGTGRDDYTIMVNHCGGVEYSHGYTKERFMQFFEGDRRTEKRKAKGEKRTLRSWLPFFK